MTFEIKKATRKKLKLKVGLQGASGSGKTYSALLLAKGIVGDWNDVYFIDTENDSATYYADLGPFNHCSFKPPYSPERFIEAIDACITDGAKVVVVDTMSHEWEGKGGCLDIHNEVTQAMRNPNSYMAWSKVTPRHNKFVDHMRTCNVHLIGCMRAKQDYILDDSKGKAVPKKVGLKGVQRDGLDYEFGLVFTIDMDHEAFAEKDRTGIFSGKPKEKISEKTGETLLKWADSGAVIGYTGTNEQKKELMRICKEDHAIEETSVLKEIHEEMISQNIAFDALEQSIGVYVAERTI